MRTIFHYDMYARHDMIIESAFLWLEDVKIKPDWDLVWKGVHPCCASQLHARKRKFTAGMKGVKRMHCEALKASRIGLSVSWTFPTLGLSLSYCRG